MPVFLFERWTYIGLHFEHEVFRNGIIPRFVLFWIQMTELNVFIAVYCTKENCVEYGRVELVQIADFGELGHKGIHLRYFGHHHVLRLQYVFDHFELSGLHLFLLLQVK